VSGGVEREVACIGHKSASGRVGTVKSRSRFDDYALLPDVENLATAAGRVDLADAVNPARGETMRTKDVQRLLLAANIAAIGAYGLLAWRLHQLQRQQWYWSPTWLLGEHEAVADIKAGRVERFDAHEDFVAALRAEPVRTDPKSFGVSA
jgi:hypothetical protein